MDGYTKKLEDYGQYKYQISAVPVEYDSFTNIRGLQYETSVTETYIKAFRLPPGEMGAPMRGVHFMYDFYPIMIKYTKETLSFTQFLTNIFAVIGGIMTMFAILDSFVYESVRIMKKKD